MIQSVYVRNYLLFITYLKKTKSEQLNNPRSNAEVNL